MIIHYRKTSAHFVKRTSRSVGSLLPPPLIVITNNLSSLHACT